MDRSTREALLSVAINCGTPCYVYFGERVLDTITVLEKSLGHLFTISYAIKCNPNVALLRNMRSRMDHVDASSIGEVERALIAGYLPENITFSGPAKRAFEIDRAVQLGIGAIVCESEQQLKQVDAVARCLDKRASVLIRINPKRIPQKFGLSMAGRASQFGVDEEQLGAVLDGLDQWHSLDFNGFHIYSGGNCLDSDAIAENFQIFVELFTTYCQRSDFRPKKLIFGSGFGIPYFDGERALDLTELSPKLEAVMAPLRNSDRFASTQCILEMGRFLTGPHGYLITQVISEKHSRGTNIRMCDAGFNNHLSACGMMGTIIRRNWKIEHLTSEQRHNEEYLLVGPLCASFDQLAAQLELPRTDVGDFLAIESSGAYGLSASPTRFISHPEPREYLLGDEGAVRPEDISEDALTIDGSQSAAAPPNSAAP